MESVDVIAEEHFLLRDPEGASTSIEIRISRPVFQGTSHGWQVYECVLELVGLMPRLSLKGNSSLMALGAALRIAVSQLGHYRDRGYTIYIHSRDDPEDDGELLEWSLFFKTYLSAFPSPDDATLNAQKPWHSKPDASEQ